MPLVFHSITKLSETYRACLSLDVTDWSESVSIEPSSSERARILGEEEEGLSLPVPARFDLWDLVWSVAEGNGVTPTGLKHLTSSRLEEKEMTTALLHVRKHTTFVHTLNNNYMYKYCKYMCIVLAHKIFNHQSQNMKQVYII